MQSEYKPTLEMEQRHMKRPAVEARFPPPAKELLVYLFLASLSTRSRAR
jgi:hypothetical protein